MFNFQQYTDYAPDTTPLLLFSGGADSTCLLGMLLRDHPHVDLLMVDGPVGPLKKKAEQQARESVIKYFDNLYEAKQIQGKIRYKHDVKIADEGIASATVVFGQPMMWLQAANMTIGSGLANHCLYVGYVSGDCAASYLDQIIEIWGRMVALTHRRTYEIRFPLVGTEKWQIIQQLPPELFALTRTCETPHEKDGEITVCGICKPCRHTRHAKLVVEHEREHAPVAIGYPKLLDHLDEYVDQRDEYEIDLGHYLTAIGGI